MDWPRILVISSTGVGSVSATGRLMELMFREIPRSQVMQLYAFNRFPPSSGISSLKVEKTTKFLTVLTNVLDFAPDVVYFRSSDADPRFLSITYRIIKILKLPTISHIMDDWLSRLEYRSPGLYNKYSVLQSEIVRMAVTNLSICDKMSKEFGKRYGREFESLANGIGKMYPPSSRSKNDVFTIRYCGGLENDMSYQSVVELGAAVRQLAASGHSIRLEIYTLERFLPIARQLTVEDCIRVYEFVPDDVYMNTLRKADLLLIAYNFNPETIGYMRFSMANKLPDCVASGTPILVYGPEEIATVDFCKTHELGTVVTQQGIPTLVEAINSVIKNYDAKLKIGSRAQEFYVEHRSLSSVYERFTKVILDSFEEEKLVKFRKSRLFLLKQVCVVLSRIRGARNWMLN